MVETALTPQAGTPQTGRLRSREDTIADAADTTMANPGRAAMELAGGDPVSDTTVRPFDPFAF